MKNANKTENSVKALKKARWLSGVCHTGRQTGIWAYGSLVCTDELLLANQRNLPQRVWELMIAALVVTKYFRN